MNKRNQAKLLEIQAELEKQMTAKGSERFYRNLEKAKAAGHEETTAYGSALIRHKVDAFASIITAWKEQAKAAPGVRSHAYTLLKDMDSHVIAFLTLKGILAHITLPVTEQKVAISIAEMIEEELLFQDVREQDSQFFGAIMNKGRHCRTKAKKKAYALSAIEMGKGTWTLQPSWDRKQKLLVGVMLLHLAERELNIITIKTIRLKQHHTVRRVHPAEHVESWINQMIEVIADTRPAYEPMVVTPRDWTTPFNGGYLTRNIAPLRLVKTRNKNYLEELTNTEMPMVYAAVNALQRTPWQINTNVLNVMEYVVEHGLALGGIPPKDDLVFPSAPPGAVEGDPEWRSWKLSTVRIYQQNLSYNSLRIAVHIGLDIARRYKQYRQIFLPYQLDFRGRIYTVPYLSPQGPDYHKSLLRFASGTPLGSEGWKWLAIHGANVAGNDKIALEDRVAWVLDNEQAILEIALDPIANQSWSKSVGGVEIDSPWQFLAFCFEWAGYVKHGEQYVSKIPIALDGSCSGIQHFSAMFKDEIGGAAVNLVPADLPSDVYKIVADAVIEKLEYDALHGVDYLDVEKRDGNIVTTEGEKTLARQWLRFGVTRKTTKRSVMTLAYGSSQYGFAQQIMQDIIKPALAASLTAGTLANRTDKYPFTGDGYLAAIYMAGLIWVKVREVLVKAGEAMDWLQSVAKLLSEDGLPVRWTTPCGFPVLQEYYEEKTRIIKTSFNGKSAKFYVNEPIDKLSKAKQAQGVSPNFIHSMDAAHMMLTLCRAKQENIYQFAMIHDSFGTTAGNTERMFHLVRESFVELYNDIPVFDNFKADVENQLSPKLAAKLPPAPSYGNLDITKVLESRYCFC